MTALATKAQVRAIHAIKSRVGLDDDDYRAALGRFGVASSKDLSRADAAAFIDRLKPGTEHPGADGAMHLTGPYAQVLRALWLSAWNLGLIRDRTDRALVAFVKRQTGIDSVSWVRDPRDASRAIEGLKAWIAREADVVWPADTDARRRKLAVINAQMRILGIADQPRPSGSNADLDEAIQAFGRAIRAAKR